MRRSQMFQKVEYGCGAAGLFDRVLPARSWEMPVERKLPAKIGRCVAKPYGHNFQNSALSLNQRYFVYIKIPLIQFQG